MKEIILLAAIISSSTAFFWPKPTSPKWDKLSVTFFKWSGLPVTKKDAEADGWSLTKSCGANSSFYGNRYVLKGDTAVMLLMDSAGNIAGIQAGVPAAKYVPRKKTTPWVEEGDMYVITAYFTDPESICTGARPTSGYIGDRLLLQTGPNPRDLVRIPFKEDDLSGTKWVKGKCFYGMGQHYWYNISANMNCDDFFPMFILYNKERLNAFGWDLIADLKSKRYEHPKWDKLGYFFQPGTKPQCLKNAGTLSTMHIYLDKRPYFNFC